jgi:branched-chain amino acid transport system ATP-binding protein
MIEHDMSFVNKVSDRILALNYGKILASGLPEEIKNNEDVKQAYMGE